MLDIPPIQSSFKGKGKAVEDKQDRKAQQRLDKEREKEAKKV